MGCNGSTSPPRRHRIARGSSCSTPSASPTRASSSPLNNFFHVSSSPSSSNNSSRAASPSLLQAATEMVKRESDAECWEKMLALQMEYHCYNSARLEAAVQAVESGMPFEEIPIPSRLCLDLLNEELRAQIEASQVDRQ